MTVKTLLLAGAAIFAHIINALKTQKHKSTCNACNFRKTGARVESGGRAYEADL
jgi:hypothetical protein